MGQSVHSAMLAMVVGFGVGLTAATAAGSDGTQHADAAPIKVGALFNLTGDQASLDGPALNGARLAVEEINAAGGVNGHALELVVHDGGTDLGIVAGITGRVINADNVAAIIGFNDSDFVLAAAPLAQMADIPFVTPGATSPKLPGQVGDNLFLACFGDNVQAAAGAEFALKEQGARTVYLLFDDSAEYTTLLAAYFKSAFVWGGGEIIAEDSYGGGDSFADHTSKVQALAGEADFLYIAAMPGDVGPIVKQLREAGVHAPIVGGDGYDTPLLVETAGAAAEGVHFTTHAFMSADGTAAVRRFYAAYEQRFNTAPENAFAALGYDAVRLVANAIGVAGSAEPAAVREALAATTGFAGVTGTVSFAPGGRVPAKTVSVIGVKDRTLTLAAELVPSFVPEP